MTTVFVSAGSGIVGYGIMKSLRLGLENIRIVSSSIHDVSVAPKFADVFHKAPMTTDRDYLKWLIHLVNQYSIDVIIPGIEADLYAWTENADMLTQLPTKPVLNNPSLVNICRDKWEFFQYLEMYNLPCVIPTMLPGDYDSQVRMFGDHLILKPRRGFGSKGVRKVSSRLDYNEWVSQAVSPLIVQPYVGSADDEFTVSVFGDGLGGYTAGIALRRQLSLEGFTSCADVVPMSTFASSIRQLCNILKPIGPTNFQFRLGDSGPMLLEINPRISSSTSMRALFGYNEAKMCVDYYVNGQLPTQPPIRGGRAIRYSEDYVTYDNCTYF
jgi:carbamoyl-phosphate synthase large subunit